MHLLSFLCRKTDGSTYVIGLQFKMRLYQMVVRPYFIKCKRLVELYHKVVPEILRNTATVTCRITYNLIFFRNHLHIRTTVESIYYHISIGRFGESKTEIRINAPSGQSPLSCYTLTDKHCNNKELLSLPYAKTRKHGCPDQSSAVWSSA